MRRAMSRVAFPALFCAGVLGVFLIGGVQQSRVAAQTGGTVTPPTTGTTTASCPAPPGRNWPGRAGFTPPAHADGTIAAINGATFTVTGKNSTTSTVTTDGNTHYDKSVVSSVSSIAAGDFVIVQGTASGNTFAATSLTDNGKGMQPLGGPGGRPHPMNPNGAAPAGTHPALPAGCKPPQRSQGTPPAGGNTGNHPTPGNFTVGTVQQVSGTTVTLKGRDGKTITVTTDPNTKVTSRQTGSFADLKVGDQVMAGAAPKSGGAMSGTAFTASHVSDQTAH